jgi:class 3 adenylate cyclase
MHACQSCHGELPDGARFCPHCGAPVVGPAPAQEMRKLVTVLFADVVGSTARGERLDPEDARALMAEYFEVTAAPIRAEGGTIEKYVGDATMAVFGVPVAHEDDAVRAVRAARAVHAALEAWNAERPPSERLDVRVGIGTGEVVATASPGADLLVTGDVVNVAARLQQACEPGRVLVAERTARAVDRYFSLRPVGELELRGKSEPASAWLVEAELEHVQPRGIGLRAPLVGRRHQLELLRTTLASVSEERRPYLVTVVGDAGMGKSRLVQELVAGLEPETKVVVGRCLAYGEGVTLWPLAEILKAEATALENDPPAVALAKIRRLVEDAVPAELAPDPAALAAALAATIGYVEAGQDPQETYRALRSAWRVLLVALARSGPLVVVVEDIHWADQTMLDVIDHLAEHAEGPILFLCTARPDVFRTRPEWGGGRRRFSSLPLDPLSRDESSELVSRLLEIDDLPQPVRERILARAEGNPFFLEEIVGQLIDQGLIVSEDGRWLARAEIGDVELPDDIYAVLLARIDLLGAAEKDVLQKAAVVGRVFWPGVLGRLCPADDLVDALEVLCRRELVAERLSSTMGGELEYAFKHVLIRDVAYESLPRRERATAHTAVAAWIEETIGEGATELAELLAFHCDAAYELAGGDELRIRARDWSLEAARCAVSRFALATSDRFARRAVELSLPGPERAATLLATAETVYVTGEGRWDAYRTAMAEVGDDSGAFAEFASFAALTAARWVGMWAQAPTSAETRELIDRGLAAAGDSHPAARSRLLTARAFLLGLRRPEGDDEDSAAASEAADEALALAESLDDPDLISAALDGKSGVAMDQGRWGLVHEYSVRRLGFASRITSSMEVADSYCMAAWSACYLGRYPEALRHAEEAVTRSRERQPGGYMHGLTWVVCAAVMVGDWERALAAQRELEAAQIEREGPLGHTRRAYAAAAWRHELRGERDEAEGYVDILREYIPTTGHLGSYASLARVLAHQGKPEEGRALLEVLGRRASAGPVLEALCEVAVAGARAGAEELVATARDEASSCGLLALPFFADRLEGVLEDDPALLRRSADGFGSLGAPWEQAWSRLLLAELTGDPVDLLDAHASFERLGSVTELERARRLTVSPV